MASARDLKKKIRSISNTAKITRTMEMVATAKSKRAQSRVEATKPYSNKLVDILTNLQASGTVDHPLLETRENVGRNLLLVVTANRGLCGGYNSNILSMVEKWLRQESAEGRETDVYLVGRKGIARFRYRRIASVEQYTHFEDNPTFKECDVLASEFMRRFLRREVDRVVVASTLYESVARQHPTLTQVLPVEQSEADSDAGGDESGGGGAIDFLFEPEREKILETLLPLSVKQRVYRLFLEAAVSEQIARRMAMKLASDNADEMIGFYTRKYNRERQAGITQQITEIVTAAEALE